MGFRDKNLTLLPSGRVNAGLKTCRRLPNSIYIIHILYIIIYKYVCVCVVCLYTHNIRVHTHIYIYTYNKHIYVYVKTYAQYTFIRCLKYLFRRGKTRRNVMYWLLLSNNRGGVIYL